MWHMTMRGTPETNDDDHDARTYGAVCRPADALRRQIV